MVPRVSEELASLSLAEISEAIRTRRVSSVDATRACIESIERSQAEINSFISFDPEHGLLAAERADEELAAGRWRGPLHGVPMAHKDMFYRKGRVSTCGSRLCETRVSDVTATVHARLDAAGAVDLGGLNMSEFAAGPTGHNERFGNCRNPWNVDHVTGGSSSGSGASVAARQVYASLGSDTGGSIRLPAAMCGVTGLKPTYGLVSRYGVMPRCWSLDVVGPLARSARDCAMLLQAVAGPDDADATSVRHDPPDYVAMLDRDVRGMRVGVPSNRVFADVDPGVQHCLDDSRRVLAEAGMEIIEVDIPDPGLVYELTNLVNKTEAAAVHGRWVRDRRAEYSLSAVNRFEAGFHVPATLYLDVIRMRSRLLARFVESVYGRVDVLHMPTLGIEVPSIEDTEIRSTAHVPRLMESITRHTRWVSYLGLPSLSVPCGFTTSRLPAAFQLVGRPFSEARLLAVAHAYQSRTQWHRADPRPVSGRR